MLPPFREYLAYLYEIKEQKCIKNGDETPKIKSCKVLIDELFNPQDKVNQNSTKYMKDVARDICKAYLAELHDPKKNHS